MFRCEMLFNRTIISFSRKHVNIFTALILIFGVSPPNNPSIPAGFHRFDEKAAFPPAKEKGRRRRGRAVIRSCRQIIPGARQKAAADSGAPLSGLAVEPRLEKGVSRRKLSPASFSSSPQTRGWAEAGKKHIPAPDHSPSPAGSPAGRWFQFPRRPFGRRFYARAR